MKISIETIPHHLQRYDTCGDWVFEHETNIASCVESIRDNKPLPELEEILKINISETGNEDSNFLIAVHELIEAYLCKKAGITGEQVDQWDMNFKSEGEPGDDPYCPYRNEHTIASYIEVQTARYLGISPEKHEGNIKALVYPEKENESPMAL